MKKTFVVLLVTLMILSSFPIFSFSDSVTNATIYISTDDAYKLYVNGDLIGEDWQDPSSSDERRWRTVESFRVYLVDDFLIAIKGADLFGTIAGVSIIVDMDEGTDFTISDSTWQVSTEVADGWYSLKDYPTEENWTDVTPVSPHSSWPTEDAGPWGWTDNAVGSEMDKVAYFKYYIPPTEEPTEGPTEPTEGPTEPTEGPTEPTENPTEPTEAPTESPTQPATEAPTNAPDEPNDEEEPVTPVAVVEVPVEVIPLAAPVVDEIVPEAVIPLDVPAVLPKTGEIPATVFMGLGGLLSTLGVYLKKR